jgi:hypothetical protein
LIRSLASSGSRYKVPTFASERMSFKLQLLQRVDQPLQRAERQCYTPWEPIQENPTPSTVRSDSLAEQREHGRRRQQSPFLHHPCALLTQCRSRRNLIGVSQAQINPLNPQDIENETPTNKKTPQHLCECATARKIRAVHMHLCGDEPKVKCFNQRGKRVKESCHEGKKR